MTKDTLICKSNITEIYKEKLLNPLYFSLPVLYPEKPNINLLVYTSTPNKYEHMHLSKHKWVIIKSDSNHPHYSLIRTLWIASNRKTK